MKPCGHNDDVPECGRCKLYRENPRVRAAWEARGGAVSERATTTAAPKVSASRSRYLSLPTTPCKYLGELLTPCTSCGGGKPERDVYACEYPGNEEGRCTRGDPGKFGAWTCGGCPNYAP